MRRVVITGYGVVCPLGNTVSQSWSNLIQGKSDDPILKNKNYPYNLSLIKNFAYKKWRVPHANSRMNNFLHAAVDQALNHSKIQMSSLDLKRAGICIGSMASSNSTLMEYVQESISKNFQNINRLSMLQILTNIPCASLNVKYKFQGPSMTVSTACATGLSAVLEGYKWIKYGQADIVIVGATQDVYNSLYLNSSLRLQAMSSKQYQNPAKSSCPFDKARSGFILGQGSGVMILESMEHAKQRKATILSQILGYGCTSDGHHLVRPQKSGEGQLRAMKLALQMAQLQPKQISVINAHATSTMVGDQIQANTILKLFNEFYNSSQKQIEKNQNVRNLITQYNQNNIEGTQNQIKYSQTVYQKSKLVQDSKQNLTQQHSKTTVISALKSSLGHTFGSAGAIQLILGIKSLQQNLVPKILNLQNPEIQLVNSNKNYNLKYAMHENISLKYKKLSSKQTQNQQIITKQEFKDQSQQTQNNIIKNRQSKDSLIKKRIKSINSNNQYLQKNSFGFGGVNVSAIFSKGLKYEYCIFKLK